MKPKTKIQKEVARLSANLRPISTTQIEWAYRHCIEHIGYRTKKGNITCSDCGHEWHSDSVLCDTLEGILTVCNLMRRRIDFVNFFRGAFRLNRQ